MKVCIAEKPSVAREIAEVLGARQRMDGYIEGNGYQVTWTFGHLCTLKEPHDYTDAWRSWNLSSLPMIPPRFGIKLISNPSYEKQFAIIERLMQNAEMVINCGDAGQEGELIQRWVMQKAGCKCPVYRLWISSLTEEAIREGFKSLHPESDYQRLYEAGLSRAIGDWLLGMNATRLYTIRYGQNKQVLSIGRVQTPTLALIVNRQIEIENFTPEPFWELKTIYRGTTFSSTKGKFTKQEEGEEFLKTVENSEFTVTDVSKKNGKEYAPRLFDLTSLQVECNKKFSLSADDTLKTIQSLYEKKITTYPRVDTTFLSDDIYPKIPQTLKGMTAYAELTAPLLASGKIPKSKRVFDNSKVTDHHAIIPTGMPANYLNENEQKVYDLVARRFIAAFYPDCDIATTTVMGKVDRVEFKVTGKQILKPGWRTVFGTEEKDPEKEGNDEDVSVLPAFTVGESGPHQPILKESWTQPPKPYTEATLLRAMETAGKLVDNEELRDALKENGIGRPSTRAAVIETLFKRNYIQKQRKSLLPTATGRELIGTIKEELLKSAELTGLWEKKLRQIEKGTYEARTFLDELKELVYQVVANVLSAPATQAITLIDPNEPKKKRATKQPTEKKPKEKAPAKAVCPICHKGNILRGKTAYGCGEYKNGCSFRLDYATYGEGLSEEALIKILKDWKPNG
ncbi:DNA topoisomerase-3 [Parabacteroides sp. PM6-13]|uniref:DNA topoisomerase 3 n=1 Tax=Parabacteroides sp. PM6-13 TaxID=1742408 RepID=UPI002476D84D|nr:DNA topoisomerase 3 [Parabacteroides sp. PM6-13]MDH6342784.1 DNA topoisomerase-3 [Parabacteroides sp. PM6-13]